ncbi:MAG: hypothetical protein IBV52_08150 [Candidatus Bathyarchaeota archaeon]
MSERIRSLFTYLIVFFMLMIALAIISPSQFKIITDLLSESGSLLSVLLFIAFLILVLKRTERL